MCQVCKEKAEEKFHEVKEYIRSHPGVGINEVSEVCEVSPSQIQQWLREERLEVAENSPIFLSCEGCGANIRSGKYCEKCKNQMAMGFRKVLDEGKPKKEPAKISDKDNPRMRYL